MSKNLLRSNGMNIDKCNKIVALYAKKIINNKEVKQYIVAKNVGYDEKIFSAMLNGRKLIKACDIPCIANALEVTSNELFKTNETDKYETKKEQLSKVEYWISEAKKFDYSDDEICSISNYTGASYSTIN